MKAFLGELSKSYYGWRQEYFVPTDDRPYAVESSSRAMAIKFAKAQVQQFNRTGKTTEML